MIEDEKYKLIEQELQTQRNDKYYFITLAHTATAEFIASQTADTLAITTLRKAFEYGYRTGFRDAKESK